MFVIYVCCFANVVRKQVNYQSTTHTSQFMVCTKEGSVFYLYIKFEADSIIRSKIIRGPRTLKLGHVN